MSQVSRARLLRVCGPAFVISLSLLAAGQVQAGVIEFTQDNVKTSVNVLDLTLEMDSTTAGFGFTNGKNKVRIIDFITDEDAEVGGGGQAKLDAVDELFKVITLLARPGQGFSILEFNLHRGHEITDEDNVTFSLTAFDQHGGIYNSNAFALLDNGENRTAAVVKIQSLSDDTLITRLVITASTNSILTLEQIRLNYKNLDGSEIPGIPEPGSMTLLALGSIGLGGFMRRKMKKEVVAA